MGGVFLMKDRIKHIVCDVILRDAANYLGVETPLCTVGDLDNPGIFFKIAGRPAIMIQRRFAEDCIEKGNVIPLIQVIVHELGEMKFHNMNKFVPGLAHSISISLEKDLFGNEGMKIRNMIGRKYLEKRMRDEEIVEEFVREL